MSTLQDEYHELAVSVAQEIAEAFKSRTPHYTTDESGQEKPVSHKLPVPILMGKPYSELNAFGSSFDHDVAYNKEVSLRRGKSIIATLEVAEGHYTGWVKAQAAMDDYDL